MKIVQIVPYAMDRPGGVQSHVRDLSAWLESRGHCVRIVAAPGAQVASREMPLGKSHTISLHGTRFELTYAKRSELTFTAKDLRQWGAEVVHLHTPWTPLMAWQIWRRLGLPGIATFHATLPQAKADPIAWALRRAASYFNKRLSAVVVPSEAPLAQWRAAGADPLPRILPPAIDLSAWRSAAQPTPNGFRVVYMGRLEERKGVAVLIEAWQRIAAERPEAQLIIAGSGPDEAMLRARVAAAKLERVTFRSPPNDGDARALVASADLFAAPALHGESFGLVLAEAMAAGTVPVAAANAGFATVLSGRGKDLLVPPGESGPLAEKILSLAAQPAKLADLRRWAQSQSQRFDINTVGPGYEALLRAAIDERSNREGLGNSRSSHLLT